MQMVRLQDTLDDVLKACGKRISFTTRPDVGDVMMDAKRAKAIADALTGLLSEPFTCSGQKVEVQCAASDNDVRFSVTTTTNSLQAMLIQLQPLIPELWRFRGTVLPQNNPVDHATVCQYVFNVELY